jgi:hypothetical protein
MDVKTLATFFFLSISFLSYAQGKATIFFIRNTGASPSKFNVFIDNSVVCKLPQRRYSMHEVTPGRHTFMAQFAGTTAKEGAKNEAVTVECEAGKTYYLNLVIREKFKWKYKDVFCEEITANTWKKLYAELPIQDNCRVE